MRNELSAWKNSCPAFADLTFEDYKEYAGWKKWNESNNHYDEKYFADYIRNMKEFNKYGSYMDKYLFVGKYNREYGIWLIEYKGM